ncbi:sulfite exporter TauE/SafE family protein [bacterium]|nr:sulfite exporter TauE/SafE family protein [bacterium]
MDHNLFHLITPTQSAFSIAITVLIASFLGSLHCLGMCGGLVLAATAGKNQWISLTIYHVARLLGYLLLAFLMGHLGQQLLSSHINQLSLYASLSISFIFIFLGLRLLLRKNKTSSFHFLSQFSQRLLTPLYNLRIPIFGAREALIGFGSILLPCGWLYTILISTIPLKSPMASMGILFVFWIGTLPALYSAPSLINRLLLPLSKRLPNLSGILLLGAGLFTFYFRHGFIFGLANCH